MQTYTQTGYIEHYHRFLKYVGSNFYLFFVIAGSACASVPAQARQDCGILNERDKETCVVENYKEADLELNRVYQNLLKNTAEPEFLRKAQRAWVQFRDAECSYVVSWETLTKNGPHLNRYRCLEGLTLYRVKALEYLRSRYESRPQEYEAF